MDFSSRLRTVFEKYPFIHIDKKGELSILIPLTGSRKINNLSNASGESTTLFLFGDNTCKADIEREKFFSGGSKNNSKPFNQLFSQLQKELTLLGSNSELTPNDQQFIKVLIQNLKELTKQTNAFKEGNPGYEMMEWDLEYDREFFLVKGEFIVDTQSDFARTLNFPNIINLINTKASIFQKLMPKSFKEGCFSGLSQIKNLPPQKKTDFISEALETIADVRDYLNEVNGKGPVELFKVIYKKIQEKRPSLKEQPDNFFEVMAENWGYLDYDESWSSEEIPDAIKQVFDAASVFEELTTVEHKTFADIYQSCMGPYSEQSNSSYHRKKTYQLFVLQTFFYLCAIQLRLKKMEHAQHFLEIFENDDELNNLITLLCSDEESFIKMMQEKYQLSIEEYNSILEALHTIAIDHLEAPHYDELRLACFPKSVQNAHYLVMGGRLYWSTVPITETSDINSQEQQAKTSNSHFEIFYNQRHLFVKKFEASETIKNLMTQEFTEEVGTAILENLRYLSEYQKEQLLVEAIQQHRVIPARLIIQQSENAVFTKPFFEAIKQKPPNLDWIETCLKQNTKYHKYLTGTQLLQAVNAGDLAQVKLIVQYRPDLIEFTDRYKQTALLWACARGKTNIVEYLIAAGANIHVRTVIRLDYEYGRKAYPAASRTAKQWAEALNKDSANSSKIVALFDNYYQFIENKFQEDAEYKNNLNKNHLNVAINNGDLRLIDLYIKYCPHLKAEYNKEEQTLALKQSNQSELVNQIAPYQDQFRELLQELQRKKIHLGRAYGRSSDGATGMFLLNKNLAQAGNKFFFHEITPQSFQQFQNECQQAIEQVKPILSQHRDVWFGLSEIFRAVVGVLAALTVIPALVVQVSTARGYTDTFFTETKKLQTDSMKKLTQFEEGLEEANIEISNIIKK